MIRKRGNLAKTILKTQSFASKFGQQHLETRREIEMKLRTDPGASVQALSRRYKITDKTIYAMKNDLVERGIIPLIKVPSHDVGIARLQQFLELYNSEGVTVGRLIREMNFANRENMLQAVRRWEKSGKISKGIYEAVRRSNFGSKSDS
jgi:transposase-like protein